MGNYSPQVKLTATLVDAIGQRLIGIDRADEAAIGLVFEGGTVVVLALVAQGASGSAPRLQVEWATEDDAEAA